jgi:hypothetical protein
MPRIATPVFAISVVAITVGIVVVAEVATTAVLVSVLVGDWNSFRFRLLDVFSGGSSATPMFAVSVGVVVAVGIVIVAKVTATVPVIDVQIGWIFDVGVEIRIIRFILVNGSGHSH